MHAQMARSIHGEAPRREHSERTTPGSGSPTNTDGDGVRGFRGGVRRQILARDCFALLLFPLLGLVPWPPKHVTKNCANSRGSLQSCETTLRIVSHFVPGHRISYIIRRNAYAFV
ncbi:hypothetical protein M758_3G251800 [Ceratodon purpureus]|uniref:Uncharacterized protein n=1 Tax=Ceratodon purpureus TaxID=3225 RepID=A0A8T0IPP9_CERPU|nr:hypothetical protein KC19_3G251100 [Ceratodon purpureus]KAG0624490.1 hypothetical protein M758_3G251800 [Ceratodon purpureus]